MLSKDTVKSQASSVLKDINIEIFEGKEVGKEQLLFLVGQLTIIVDQLLSQLVEVEDIAAIRRVIIEDGRIDPDEVRKACK